MKTYPPTPEFVVRFFTDCVAMINRGAPNVDKYLRVLCGKINPDTGSILVDNRFADDDYGTVIVYIAFRELFEAYLMENGKPVNRSTMQQALRKEEAWIKYIPEPHTHRLQLPHLDWKLTGRMRDIRRSYWALSFAHCSRELWPVFLPLYEQAIKPLS
jgi:hypothetical protein